MLTVEDCSQAGRESDIRLLLWQSAQRWKTSHGNRVTGQKSRLSSANLALGKERVLLWMRKSARVGVWDLGSERSVLGGTVAGNVTPNSFSGKERGTPCLFPLFSLWNKTLHYLETSRPRWPGRCFCRFVTNRKRLEETTSFEWKKRHDFFEEISIASCRTYICGHR